MDTYLALIVAGIIFSIVALVHLLRLFYKTEIIVAGKIIPLWASVFGFIVPLLLAIWMFMAATQ